jgi:hypothetical protein
MYIFACGSVYTLTNNGCRYPEISNISFHISHTVMMEMICTLDKDVHKILYKINNRNTLMLFYYSIILILLELLRYFLGFFFVKKNSQKDRGQYY